MNFRSWLARAAAGRNGMDRLNIFIYVISAVLLIVSALVPGRLGSLFGAACMVGLILGIFRFSSRNTVKRSAENQAYLRMTAKLRKSLGVRRTRFEQRKEYRFFKCPSCRNVMRVPRGKGRISVTCRRCGERFIRNS
ncbi:MAG: hypothetical protein K5855_09510 [Oscillospiraceae bacterium]|nr:hypothetical protein [Oscillospiraceae bacterium]